MSLLKTHVKSSSRSSSSSHGWFLSCATATFGLLSIFMAVTVGVLQFQSLPLLIVGPSDRVKTAGSCPFRQRGGAARQRDNKVDYQEILKQMEKDQNQLHYTQGLDHDDAADADETTPQEYRDFFRAKRVVHVKRTMQESQTAVDDFRIGKFCHREMQNDGNMTLWTCLDCGSSPSDKCTVLPRRGRCLDAPSASERDLQRRGKFGRTSENLDLPEVRATLSHARPSSSTMRTTLLAHFKKPSTYESIPCTLDKPECFDLSKCPNFTASEPLWIYPRGNPKGEAVRIVQEAQAARPDLVQLAKKPHEACLLMVGPDSYKTKEELFQLDNFDQGRNHFVWHSPTIWGGFGDFPYHDVNFQMASLVSGTLTDAHVRRGFDFVLPLPAKWRRPRIFDDLELHRPRKYLITFKGGMKPLPAVYYQHRWLAAEYWPQDDPQVLVDVDCDDLGYELDSDEAFGESLLNSTFVFCPGGNGVSSYRFAEALMADAIPVVTANHLPPLHPEVDWSDCVVQVSEARIVDLPRLLRRFSPQQVKQRQVLCQGLFEAWIGKTAFVRPETGQAVWMRPPHWTPFFLGVVQTWKFRIAQAHAQVEAQRAINKVL